MSTFATLPKENFSTAKEYFEKNIFKHVTAATTSDDSIIVYQAYKPEIAEHAVKHQTFENCPEFSMSRMTWIKTNYLWMMYRCDYGRSKNQERILALHINKDYFEDVILANGVLSHYNPEMSEYYGSKENWEQVIEKQKKSDICVRVQWDPYHEPNFNKLEGVRAIQLGLKGKIVKEMMTSGNLKKIEDITTYATEQYALWKEGNDMVIPVERHYPISSEDTRRRLQIAQDLKNSNK